MSEKKSITCNAVLNVIKVGMGVIFPLITFPYASRVLQVESLGKVNYGDSIINYFALFAALGITVYAVREGAKIREERQKFEIFAREVFSMNLITSFLAYLFLGGLLLFAAKLRSYTTVIAIQSLSILFHTLGVEWMNTVYEDYLYITIRSIVVQTASLIFLLVFVKSPDDYLLYASLAVLSNGIICLANLLHCRKYAKLRFVWHCNWKKHLKPMLIFFSNNLAITVYISADTTMLGWLCGDYYTGLYAVAVKIYQIIKELLTAVYAVTIPRLSAYAQQEDHQLFRELLTQICSGLILLMFPASVGLMVLSEDIIVLICGDSYLEVTLALQILSIALLFAVASGVIVNCINTPLGKEKNSLKATVIAAAANIGLNVIAIPLFQQNGAAFTTAVSEFLVSFLCLLSLKEIKEYLNLKTMLQQLYQALCGCAVIGVVSAVVKQCAWNHLMTIVVTMIGSIAGYLLLLIVLRNPYVNGIKKRLFAVLQKAHAKEKSV